MDGRTNRETDRIAISMSRVSALTRDKNRIVKPQYTLVQLKEWICWNCLKRNVGMFFNHSVRDRQASLVA